MLQIIRNRCRWLWGADGKAANIASGPPSRGMAWANFILLCLGYFLLVFFLEHHWLLSGEMWAEAATSYYFKATHSNILIRLFHPEAGYLALLGRALAFIGNEIKFPATMVPYYYNFSAIIITAISGSMFCLPVFRHVIVSDALRLTVATAFLTLFNFETITFINFAYCGLLVIIGLTIVSLKSEDVAVAAVPWWAWLFTIFILSKPQFVLLFPFFVAAAFVARRSWRILMIACAVAALLQLMSIVQNHASFGTQINTDLAALFEVPLLLLLYAGGFMTALWLGHEPAITLAHISPYALSILGTVIFIALARLFWISRGVVRQLLLIGMLLILGTLAMNIIVMPGQWNFTFAYFEHFQVYRHVLPAFLAGYLIVGAVMLTAAHAVQNWSSRQAGRNQLARYLRLLNIHQTAVVFFVFWFLASGWAYRGISGLAIPDFPITSASSWQQMASHLDAKLKPLCIPINPYPWRVEHHCGVFAPTQMPDPQAGPYRAVPWPGIVQQGIKIEAPVAITQKEKVLGIGFVLKPHDGLQRTVVRGYAVGRTTKGKTILFTGRQEISARGGLIYLAADISDHHYEGIGQLQVYFDAPVRVAIKKDSGGTADTIWYIQRDGLPILSEF